MEQQKSIFNRRTHRRIVVAADRRTPAVWVAELCVLRELAVDDHQIVRRIHLRRGMNILWAREPDSQREKRLFEDSISGHSAGKTTFCRFMRYVLGEPHFGDEQLRQEIRRAFPNGWIAGQVFVSGMRWAVFRPIGIGAHPFVVRDASLEDALALDAPREPLDIYRDALNLAFLSTAPSDWLSVRGDLLRWDHLLPWLARDQDCHFASLTTWRDPSSDSDSPQLDAFDRQLLLRAILGLISDEEDKERRANDDRNTARKTLAARRPAFLHQAAVDRTRLETTIGKTLPPFDEGLFRNAVTQDLDAFEQDGLTRLSATSTPITDQELAELERRLDEALLHEAEKAAEVKTLTKSLRHHQNTLEELRGNITDERRKQMLEDLGPSRGFCNVPIQAAVKAGCPLATSRPIKLADRVGEMGLDEQAAQHEEIVKALANRLAVVQAQLKPPEAAAAKARDTLRDARRQFAAQVQQLADFRSQVGHLRRLAEEAERAWVDANVLDQQETILKEEIAQSYKRQESIREQLTNDLNAFSACFDHFIAALMGESVEGKVTFSGRDIDLKVLYRGERRSSAIKILTNIAFDLAALTSSIEGRGLHPCFLIHDGPREADMSPGLYRKVFLLVQMLEECVGPGDEPAFQYIITTTEAPPASLQAEPWLLDPVLDAADSSKRFLGVDL